jgi:hypothetical protein
VLSNDVDASVIGAGSLKDSKSGADVGSDADETSGVALGAATDLVWGEPAAGRSVAV